MDWNGSLARISGKKLSYFKKNKIYSQIGHNGGLEWFLGEDFGKEVK